MYFRFTGCCARILRGVATLGLALFALNLVESSVCHATSLSHGSYVIDIQVVNSAGPIRVGDQYTGVANNGLPTIEIYEKFTQPGNEQRFWADVELQVKVRSRYGDDDHHDGSFFDDIHDIFDNILNLFPWNNEEEDNWSQGGEGPGDWQDDVVIGIDKFVKNRTGVDWRGFRIELGTGIGDGFVPSGAQDDLYIVSDPMAKETTSFYDDPPGRNFPGSDYLQWTSDGVSRFGQSDGDRAGFWFGVHIPQDMFEPSSRDHGCWNARFTLRQHTGMPEPTTGVLLLTATMMSFLSRKTKLR